MESVLYACRRLWNHFLAQRIETYRETKKSVSCFDQARGIPSLAVKDACLKEVYSQVLQDVPRRLDKAFQAFFRRLKQGETPGFPRFKASDRYNSFTYPQFNGSFKMTEDGKMHLSKIGCIKIAYHREAKGLWKTCTVKRTSTGKWYVVISVEQESVRKHSGNITAVGMDLGLKEFAVFSDGSRIKRARFFKAEENALAKAQRKLAKQTKGTLARRKVRKVIARLHERIVGKRNDFTHQASRRVADTYGVICVEDLDINGMKEQKTIVINGKERSARGVHRSINDVAWLQFVNQLKYKAEEAGSSVIMVNPKNTTKTCSICGKIGAKDLSERQYVCECGHAEDRDLNASRNILRLGLQSLETLKKAS